MEGDEIGFDGNYPVGDYLYRHWSMKSNVQKGETDDEAWQRVENACWNRYAKQYPEWAEWFKNNQAQPTPEVSVTKRFEDSIRVVEPTVEVINLDKGKEVAWRFNETKPEPTLEEQIKSCTDIKILESYKFIVKGKPEQEVYNKKLKEYTRTLS
jgi:hypothetical protein